MDIKNYVTVKLQAHFGATVNVIPKKFIVNQPLSQSNISLQVYNKSTLKPVGKTRIILTNTENQRKYNVEFEVVKENLIPILCRKAVE